MGSSLGVLVGEAGMLGEGMYALPLLLCSRSRRLVGGVPVSCTIS